MRGVGALGAAGGSHVTSMAVAVTFATAGGERPAGGRGRVRAVTGADTLHPPAVQASTWMLYAVSEASGAAVVASRLVWVIVTESARVCSTWGQHSEVMEEET